MSKGLASVKTLTAKEIADKWKLPLGVVAKKIAAGVKVEKEHTKSTRQANEIARDHLGERPDYYEKLDKMEKKKVVKEETTTSGVGGLGFRTGTPAVDEDNDYVSTNALAYDPLNGARLDFIKKIHSSLHSNLGFNEFNPKSKDHFNKALAETKLNELGEYDNKGGTKDSEGLTDPHPKIYRKNEMKEHGSPANISYTERPIYERGKTPADMTAAAERGIYQEEAEDLARYKAGFGGVETAGEKNPYTATNRAKTSRASGFYQYVPKTWQGVTKKYGVGTEYKTAKEAPPEVQDKVWSSEFSDNMKKYGLKGAVNIHYTGNAAGHMSKKALAANKGFTADQYFKKFEKNVAKYDTAKTSTQVAKAPETSTAPAPKAQPAQVAAAKPSLSDTVRSKVAGAFKSLTSPDTASAKPSEPVTPKAPEPAKVSEPQGKFDVSYAKPDDENKMKSATQTSQTSSTPDVSSSTYTVKKGDTLSGIAKTYGSDVGTLAKSSNISDPNKIMPGQTINVNKKLNELKSETLGSYIKKASKSRKAALNTGTGKADIETWSKRQKGITTAIDKLTREAWMPFFTPHHKHSARLNKKKSNTPDIIVDPGGVKGQTKYGQKFKEETKMNNKEHINEALDCILENNLSEMKDNLMLALQEKVMEKLEERKKEIAAQYFAQ